MFDSTDTWIRGVAMTPFVKRSEDTFGEMAQKAIIDAVRAAGLTLNDIDEVVCGTGYGGALAGQRIAGPLGLTGPRITNVENACSSGLAAVAVSAEAIQSGRAETVAAVGVDRLSDLGRGALPLSQEDIEVRQGAIMPAIYAMRAARYLSETGATIEDIANISVKSRRYGKLNPYAQMRDLVSIEEVLDSRAVSTPLTLFMCCPRGDGAAAAILSAHAPGVAEPGVKLKGLAIQSGRFSDGFRDMTRSELSERTARAAYESAGLTPADIQVVETHDAFAIAELMYYESLGFAEIGEGWRLIRDGSTEIDGRVAVNPSGGLLSRGHPVGATGVAQVCEAYWQLAGLAGDRQVSNPENVLTHCTGGGISGFDHGAAGVSIVGRA